MIEFLLDIQLNKKITNLSELFVRKPVIELHFKDPDYEFIAWGDPIMRDGFKENLTKNLTPEFIINNLYGHYYYLLLNKITRQLFAGNSIFSVLPLYYFQNAEKLVFSNNSIILGKHLDLTTVSQRFMVEVLLFNYPLFNSTLFEEISLLQSNSYLQISNSRIETVKHTTIEKYFASDPKPWKKSIAEIRDIFLEEVKKYLPKEYYIHALTGGFDGRTLVSAGLYYDKDFSCYSFGSVSSNDTQIASRLASKARISFLNIKLNDEYAEHDSLNCGEEFIMNSSGTGTFARAHYLYSAKKLSNESQYIITGNFGSEIFRAAHVAGAVISSNLYALFDSEHPEEGIKKVENSMEFQCLNSSSYKKQLESLKEDIIHMPCYDNSFTGLTKNQKFYVFVFEEVFRKYFGAEIINQFRYIKNRTPFLDMEFLKAIFRSELAGIHSDFFEHNPFKRYKGQVLYAHIIRKAYPEFGKMMTDKGYRPDDLINQLGKLNIVKGYLNKVIRKPIPDFDPYAVSCAWQENRRYWESLPILPEYFNYNELLNENREILFKVLSLSYLFGNI